MAPTRRSIGRRSARRAIGAGTKIDNLVQIAHGVTIGRNVLLAAQVGIAGSTTIEDNVTLAGQVGVAGHLTIGKGVDRDRADRAFRIRWTPGAFVSGYPAISEPRLAAIVGGVPQAAGAAEAVADLEPDRGARSEAVERS